MSEPRRSRRAEASRGPLTLPQWAIEVARPIVRKFSHAAWKLQFKGVENIPSPAQGGLIIAANHQTYIDPFWISIPIKRPVRYLAWDEAFKMPVLGKLLELLGAWPLQVEGSDPTAIRRSLQWLRSGGAVVIFPEGARALADGEMAKFKPGAARMALEARVPILPVTIRGAHRVWPRGQTLPRLGQIEVIYHPLYIPKPQPGEETRACARRVSAELSAIVGSAL